MGEEREGGPKIKENRANGPHRTNQTEFGPLYYTNIFQQQSPLHYIPLSLFFVVWTVSYYLTWNKCHTFRRLLKSRSYYNIERPSQTMQKLYCKIGHWSTLQRHNVFLAENSTYSICISSPNLFKFAKIKKPTLEAKHNTKQSIGWPLKYQHI